MCKFSTNEFCKTVNVHCENLGVDGMGENRAQQRAMSSDPVEIPAFSASFRISSTDARIDRLGRAVHPDGHQTCLSAVARFLSSLSLSISISIYIDIDVCVYIYISISLSLSLSLSLSFSLFFVCSFCLFCFFFIVSHCLSLSLIVSLSISLYIYLSICIYIYACCGVFIWSKFGLLRGDYLVQVC